MFSRQTQRLYRLPTRIDICNIKSANYAGVELLYKGSYPILAQIGTAERKDICKQVLRCY